MLIVPCSKISEQYPVFSTLPDLSLAQVENYVDLIDFAAGIDVNLANLKGEHQETAHPSGLQD